MVNGEIMTNKDYRDILGGLLMVVFGVFAAVYAQRYELGTLQRMGPGYFPIVLGWLLAILGVFIMIPGFLKQGTRIKVDWGPLLWVTLSIVIFGVALNTLGLIITAFLMVVVSSVPGLDMNWTRRLVSAACVSFITYVIFSFLLGMVIPVWPWSY